MSPATLIVHGYVSFLAAGIELLELDIIVRILNAWTSHLRAA
jgi:hypothetical protein